MTLAAERTHRLLDELLGGGSGADVAVRLWDGTEWRPDSVSGPRATVLLRHPGALRAMLWPPTELTLAQAYLHDDFDVEGDLEAVFPLADTLTRPFTSRRPGLREGLRLAQRVFELPDRLLDLGCGWGALVLHAAERYGVQARGITLSEPQAELARERIRAAGLGRRAAVEVRDYRELDNADGFDKIVSVGMFEHVGAALLPEYFRRAATLLRPGGVFLNHGIARLGAARRALRSSFVSRCVFPDGELVPLAVTVGAAEAAGLEVRDVENLREHYTLTLRHWIANLERNHEAAVAAAGEEAYRVWRLYMAGSAHAFARGRLAIHQILLAKPDHGRAGLPLTREDWYAD